MVLLEKLVPRVIIVTLEQLHHHNVQLEQCQTALDYLVLVIVLLAKVDIIVQPLGFLNQRDHVMQATTVTLVLQQQHQMIMESLVMSAQ
jgi:hypothetical protein